MPSRCKEEESSGPDLSAVNQREEMKIIILLEGLESSVILFSLKRVTYIDRYSDISPRFYRIFRQEIRDGLLARIGVGALPCLQEFAVPNRFEAAERQNRTGVRRM